MTIEQDEIDQATPARKTLRILEATVGAFFTFAFGLVLLVASGVMAYGMWNDNARWLVLPVVIPACLELRFLYVLKVKLEEGHYPFAPFFALHYSHWTWLLRPLVALWWLAHFGAGIGAIILADNILVLKMTDSNTRVLRSLLFVAVSFSIAYSTNLYLLLATTAGGGGPRAVNRIWRYRFLLDLTIAIIAAFFPILSRRDQGNTKTPAIPPDTRLHHPIRQTATTTRIDTAQGATMPTSAPSN